MTPLENVIANPHSVRAREALVRDWRALGDPRADFVESQVNAHLHRFGAGSRWDLFAEIDRLIEKHGREWAGQIAEIATIFNYKFELGLVASIGTSGQTFIERAAELVKLAPIVHLAIDPPIDLAQIAAVPELAQFRTLSVLKGPWIDDAGVEALANSVYARGLRGINLPKGEITARGQQALAGSKNLPDIVYIDVTGNPCCASRPRGIRVEVVNGRHYLVGEAGIASLDEARQKSAMGYDPENILWPPSDEELAYEP